MLHIPYWVILFCVLLFLFIIYQILSKRDDIHKIPGPKGIFLLGNSLDILKDTEKTFSYFQENARKFKDIFCVRLAHKKLLVVYSPDHVEALLSGIAYSRKGNFYRFLKPWLKDGLLLSYGKKWQQRRKILTPAFHFNVLRHFSTIIVKNCDRLVNQLEPETDRDQTDVLSIVANFTLHSICETAMGTKLEGLSDSGDKYKNAIQELGINLYKRFSKTWLHFDPIFKYSNLARYQNELLHLTSTFRDNVLKSRRQNLGGVFNDVPTDEDSDFDIAGKNLAMLDILLKAESEGKINEDGISEEVDTFMFEGHDTTSTALQYTLMLLANNEEAQDKILAELDQIYGSTDRAPNMSDLSEMKYLECCIKESLRLYPPVYFILRDVDQPLKLNDDISVSGCEITIFIYHLHRREDQFIEPLKFMPERFMREPTWHRYAYIPFSAGPRNCIGQKFAMMEMKLAISSVLRKYRLLPVTKPEDMVITSALILRSKDPVYVKFEKRLKKYLY